MLLNIRSDHRNGLEHLCEFSPEVGKEFVRVAVENLKKEVSHKVYNSAAQKLEVSPDKVQSTVEGIAYVLLEAARLKLNDVDLKDSLLSVGLPEQVQQEIADIYDKESSTIRSALLCRKLEIPHLNGIEWRLEAQIATRSCHNHIVPQYIVRMKIGEEAHVLSSDIPTLKHITEELERALYASKSQHVNKVKRYIK